MSVGDGMKITIGLAVVTSSLSHLGMTGLAELTYVVTTAAAWTDGGRAIATALSRESVDTVRSPRATQLPTLTSSS
jgi:hypothetical protein